jgi:hypothetical protein
MGGIFGRFAIRWVQQPWEVDFDEFREGEQLVNVTRGVEHLSSKANLLRNVLAYTQVGCLLSLPYLYHFSCIIDCLPAQ